MSAGGRIGARSMDMEEYRKDAEDFSKELGSELYRNGAGLSGSLDVSSVFRRHGRLFEKEQVLALLGEADALRGGTEGEPRRARYLAWFGAHGFLSLATSALTDAIVSGETQARVEFEGAAIPFRSVQVVLANEPGARARAALESSRQEVTRRYNPKREERIEILRSLAGELGFSDYGSLCAKVKGLDLESLGQQAREFLDETDRPYTRVMEKAVSSILGMRLAEAGRHDVGFLFRGVEFDDAFPGDGAIAALEASLAEMGLGREAYPNIEIDAEAREGKSPRAFCAPLDIPGRVVLVVMPHGGHDDYHSILHEAGHAWHYGSVRRDLPFEHKWLGDDSVTESYAFLFQYLATSEDWLGEHIRGPRLDHYRRFALTRKLYMLRRYSAKLLYEIELHRGAALVDMRREYAGLLTDALKIAYPEVDYLADLDDGFYVAEYLRAWMFELRLREFLSKKFGERWYAYPETGQALRELFAEGQRLCVEELCETLGMPGPDMDPLSWELVDNLKA